MSYKEGLARREEAQEGTAGEQKSKQSSRAVKMRSLRKELQLKKSINPSQEKSQVNDNFNKCFCKYVYMEIIRIINILFIVICLIGIILWVKYRSLPRETTEKEHLEFWEVFNIVHLGLPGKIAITLAIVGVYVYYSITNVQGIILGTALLIGSIIIFIIYIRRYRVMLKKRREIVERVKREKASK